MNKIIKSGFVSIVGKPNVGKSTLLNKLIGEKVAIVTHKPQTTRNSITAILNTENSQIVFIDTPGMHRPKTKLGEIMVKSFGKAISDNDIVLFVVEPTNKLQGVNLHIIERFKALNQKVILIINKIDTVSKEKLILAISAYKELYEFVSIIPICALDGDGVKIIISEIEKLLEIGPMYFPLDMYTDQPEKQIVAEIIREKALKSLDDEIPHGIAVEIDKFKERENKKILDICAIIYCEKDTHKAIIIGKKGATLKIIASRARQDMEVFFGCKVYLQCWVKVKDDWRNNGGLLRNFGYE